MTVSVTSLSYRRYEADNTECKMKGLVADAGELLCLVATPGRLQNAKTNVLTNL